jgi:hypothetical protein
MYIYIYEINIQQKTLPNQLIKKGLIVGQPGLEPGTT